MARKARIILGLNSGTSADGVDAVACEVRGRGVRLRARVLDHLHRAYPPQLRDRLLAVMAPATTQIEEICRLEVEVGRAFARAASDLVRRLGLRRVDLIGSHGQTICHLPPGHGAGSRTAGTVHGSLQIGDAAVISESLGCPVVHRFRQADMAVGGQGAPLVPWTDYVLFGDARRSRIVQNIGGIANLTWLPARGRVENVMAFDTGPGNMMIDAVVRRITKGRELLDRGGRRAARGRISLTLLKMLLAHPYLTVPPPKSCGREQFGEVAVERLIRRLNRGKLRPDDWVATMTHFSAICMMLGYAWISDLTRRGYPPMDEIILCGGGAKNRTLVRQLTDLVNGGRRRVTITTTEDYGIAAQAKEGLSFAMMAAAFMDRVPANLPRVTGARRRVILGQVCDTGRRP